MFSYKMLILAISVVIIFPFLASSRNVGPHNRPNRPYKRARHHEMPQYHRTQHDEPQYRQRLHADGYHEHNDEPSHLTNQNLIHSKARQKTQQTLNEIQQQAYLEAYPHIQKLKKGSSGDGLLSSFDKSAKKLTKSFVKKYMPFIYNKTPYEQRIGNPVNIVPLMYTAATLTLELISLASRGTPALYGIDPQGVIEINAQGILG